LERCVLKQSELFRWKGEVFINVSNMSMAAATDSSPPVIKILVLGDAAVGKTSVIRRYVDNIFSPVHQPTVGVDFFLKEIAVDASRGATVHTVHVQLWDMAGQDRSKKINRVYYKGALGALIVYDISRPETFNSAAKWKKELDNNVTLPNGEPLPVVLLGNKVCSTCLYYSLAK
ncbi:unnamed protein product, partial [Sphacelaria rigidula]